MWYPLEPFKASAEHVSIAFRSNSGKPAAGGQAGRRMVVSLSGALASRMGLAKADKVHVLFSPEHRMLLVKPGLGAGASYPLTGSKVTLAVVIPIDAGDLGPQDAERVAHEVWGANLMVKYPAWLCDLPAFVMTPFQGKPVSVPGLVPPPAMSAVVHDKPTPRRQARRAPVAADPVVTAAELAELAELPAPREAAPGEAAPIEPVPTLQPMPDGMAGLVAAVKADPVLDAFCRRIADRTAKVLAPSAERAPITEPLMPHLRQAEPVAPVLVPLTRRPYLLQGAALGPMAPFEGSDATLLQPAVKPEGPPIVAEPAPPAAADPGPVQASPDPVPEPIEMRILHANGDGTFQELSRVQPSAAHATAAEADAAVEDLRASIEARVPEGVTVTRDGDALVIDEHGKPPTVEAGGLVAPFATAEPGDVVAELQYEAPMAEPVPPATGAVSAREQAAEDRRLKAAALARLWEEAEERLAEGEAVIVLSDELGLASADLSRLARELRKAGRRA